MSNQEIYIVAMLAFLGILPAALYFLIEMIGDEVSTDENG